MKGRKVEPVHFLQAGMRQIEVFIGIFQGVITGLLRRIR